MDGWGMERTRRLAPRHMPMRPPNSRLAAVCGEASCQICRISSAADSSNFLHFQDGDSGNRAGCQISLGSKIFRRAGWEKRQILADLICLLLLPWFVGRVGVGGRWWLLIACRHEMKPTKSAEVNKKQRETSNAVAPHLHVRG